jgi:putative flavoprotein involved in K+ transport
MRENIETNTVVVGGGQAGLVTGFHLAGRQIDHVILDAHHRVGDAWRQRWDSLALFTPARASGLDGMPFPARGDHYPTKDEMADYLEAYARRFDLPIRTDARVERARREASSFVIETASCTLRSKNLVVAMSNYQQPRIPTFAGELDPGITQLHSVEYRNASQVADGPVLVVGAGNSGAEIAFELANTHRTLLAGRESGHIPFRIERAFGRHVGSRLVPFVGHRIVSLATPVGRKVRPKFLKMSAPLVRVKPSDLAKRGVERVTRVTGVDHGRPIIDGHQIVDAKTVIWCTGFTPGFTWLDLPAFSDDGSPLHDRGVSTEIPGLYFVGRKFQYAASSDTLVGVSRDAFYVVNALASRNDIPVATMS